MSKKVKQHDFRGKRYKILFKKRVKNNIIGLCDCPNDPDKAITIQRGLDEYNELQTIIHEGLHACFWDIDEEAIIETSRDMSKLLWRLGYRKEK